LRSSSIQSVTGSSLDIARMLSEGGSATGQSTTGARGGWSLRGESSKRSKTRHQAAGISSNEFRPIYRVGPPSPCLADLTIPRAGKRCAGVCVWDLKSHHVVRTLGDFAKLLRQVAYSPNGELLAARSFDGSVRVWEAARGRLAFDPGAQGDLRRLPK